MNAHLAKASSDRRFILCCLVFAAVGLLWVPVAAVSPLLSAEPVWFLPFWEADILIFLLALLTLFLFTLLRMVQYQRHFP